MHDIPQFIIFNKFLDVLFASTLRSLIKMFLVTEHLPTLAHLIKNLLVPELLSYLSVPVGLSLSAPFATWEPHQIWLQTQSQIRFRYCLTIADIWGKHSEINTLQMKVRVTESLEQVFAYSSIVLGQ